ncbi:MAG: hypothetical protein HY978_04735 [Candidatus Liptonbacteria bacterium]|nr:hypothetical protein [Candidatus Liptonbacteria bacterium]
MFLGHESIVQTFQRLAVEQQLGHGYLLNGQSGSGKRTFATYFLNFLETSNFAEPGALTDGLSIGNGENAISIDEIRELKRLLWQAPIRSRYRSAVIDGADHLTEEAQNALLKITEEPPPSGLLFLTCSDPELLLPALRSRFQEIYFPNLPEAIVSNWLVKKHGLKKAEADQSAHDSFGLPGLALRLHSDTALAARLAEARKLLRLTAITRKATIKELVAPDEFNLPQFLDALILVLGAEVRNRHGSGPIWHKLLKLRNDANFYNLNPRIQLEALLLN